MVEFESALNQILNLGPNKAECQFSQFLKNCDSHPSKIGNQGTFPIYCATVKSSGIG